MPSRSDSGVQPTRRNLLTTMAVAAPALAMTASTGAFAQAGATDLARALDAYNRATVANDVATLANLVAEDYMLVNSDTTIQGKQSYLDDFNVPGFRIDPYVMEQQFQKIWGDTALTGGLFHLAWTQSGEHHSRWLRVAHVWTRADGRWQIAYTQLTRVPRMAG